MSRMTGESTRASLMRVRFVPLAAVAKELKRKSTAKEGKKKPLTARTTRRTSCMCLIRTDVLTKELPPAVEVQRDNVRICEFYDGYVKLEL